MSQDAPQQEPQSFTSADRIQQLNEVDKDVTRLIHSAGLAIQALTNAKPDASSPATGGSLDSHKARFTEATSQYFALLSSIDVRLRRQVYAMEESSLLAPEISRTGDTKGRSDKSSGASMAAYNPLEISRLNSRKDSVGKDKEAELWAAARTFVEQLDKPGSGQPEVDNDPDNMQVD